MMQAKDLETIMKGILKPGEPFEFRCLQCGKCCRNREDILLNPYDLHRIAKELQMTPDEVVEKYCLTYIGDSSRFPCVLLKPKGDRKICPLLKKGKFMVHKNKPTVCALFPLGRGIGWDTDNRDNPTETGGVYYFLQPTRCGARDEQHTAEEWLGEFNLQDSEAWFIDWSKSLTEMSILLRKAEKRVPQDLMDRIYNGVFVQMYLEYDMTQDFMPQFQRNKETSMLALKAVVGKGK